MPIYRSLWIQLFNLLINHWKKTKLAYTLVLYFVQTLFFVWFFLSGWFFRFFILATWVLPFAAPLLIGAFANNFAIEVLILFFTLEIRKIVQHDFFPYIALNIINSAWMRLNFHLAWGPFKFFYLGLSYNTELEKFLCWFSYACKESLSACNLELVLGNVLLHTWTIGRIFWSNSGRHMSIVKILKDLNGLVMNPNGGAN